MSVFIGAKINLPAGAIILATAFLAACNGADPAAAPGGAPVEPATQAVEPAPESAAAPEAPLKDAAPAATQPAAAPAHTASDRYCANPIHR